ncbi:MAG TPA: adenylate/guanylate cyclase domain-containing protein, partial [Casimicrobiaceae bacterium]|nr:adenylate/guanylate cyclase domain-containing protein [Casimicrobiaceae bacterium]
MLTSGPFTFLFTDIEGSTELWERRAAEMRGALELHDRVLRQSIESASGRVVKTTGDGVLAVFDNAEEAVGAAIAVQRALQAAAASDPSAPVVLKVRMGLHTGEAVVRGGDYFGSSVNRAARVMSAAHGEQILLSAATARLVCDAPLNGVALRELGELRLKGLPHPELLLQVVASGLRAQFPP